MKIFSRSKTPEITLAVEGMSCSACVGHVQRALQGVPGVVSAQVDLQQKRAVVSGAAAPDALTEAVEEAGYSAKLA